MALSLRIKTTNGRIVETVADPDLTIYDLKAICCDQLNTAPENQTLLFRGKICDDDDTLEDTQITDKSTLICLISKKKKKKKKKKERENEGKQEMNANVNMMDMNHMMSMQQSLMANPEMLKQVVDNPMMQQMLNNPEILQNIFNSSPALQGLLRDNPQLRHVLKDPSLMKHAMRAASNPQYYNEMLKNNDRALRNIESIPGGFSALSRLYNQIQRPMERAMDDMYRQRFGKSNTKITDIDKSNGPTVKPMDNPWSREYHQKQAVLRQQQQWNRLNNNNNNKNKNNKNNVNNMFNNMNMTNIMNIMKRQQRQQQNENENENQCNSSELYVIQLRELRNMGFNDEERNVNVLIATGGNVGAAVNILTKRQSDQTSDNNNNNNNNNNNKK